MDIDLKVLLTHYLRQLDNMLEQIPEESFSASLSDNMFSLAGNARIAANFALRGYCPLVGVKTVSFDLGNDDQNSVREQISATLDYLEGLPAVETLNKDVLLSEKAGFTELNLPQPEFLHHYIMPNFFFHISMVYAIAKSVGVDLGKADFDGYHSYPVGFSWLKP
ncbi:MAG: DUF1993 domain-containing protein [Gammaproteobacteria bacterium]|nr:DUF1993 domain-containing protein [Gammaproteobacteria bacterium]MBU1467737.1 DUF1993 domain-containing protein [Gammaproteobacteria bacterium]MBU2020809.1 DUF1993 domain-containing protein [Gammaproteobacteria bacterium]MBU2239025.1 DUF1993 domain-containing protein [Gammaproteobacteria bacterium]MBU2415089.1 DUF1993 domain-containing protein [Gammaproteobacteria bacterium]